MPNDENICPQSDMLTSRRTSRTPSARRKSSSRAHAKLAEKGRMARHPCEKRIEVAVLTSERLRQPVHFQIHNASNWFRIRKVLKGKRQSAHIVKRDESGKQFSAAIIDVKKDTGVGGYKPVKRSVGVFPTILQAHQACEEACTARDERGLDDTKSTDMLATHFFVQLVHPAFEKLSHSERIEMVYEALLGEFFIPNDPSFPSSHLDGCSIRGISYIGACVSNLGQFQHLGGMPFELMLDLQSPMQYKKEALPASMNSMQQYALREIVREAGAHNPSQKGVFGHFFHDLNNNSRGLLMDEYSRNVKLARGDAEVLQRGIFKASEVRFGQDLHHRHRDSADPTEDRVEAPSSTEMSSDFEPLKKHQDDNAFKMSDPSSSAFSEKNISLFGGIEDEVITKYHITVHAMTSSAKRVQRTFRLGCLPRMQRSWARRHRAALNIQRWLRGQRGRQHAADWRALRDACVLKIQAARRGLIGRREAREKKKDTTAFVLMLQPVVRGWIARSYSIWLQGHWQCAIVMQRIVRGFLGRRRAHATQIMQFMLYLTESAIRIQSATRGYIGRKRRNAVLADMLQRFVMIPCIVAIQSYWRMSLARHDLEKRKVHGDAAKEIQRLVRGSQCRSWIQHANYRVYQHACASRLQAHVRGWIHRDLLQKRRRRDRHYTTVVPSAIMLQAKYRGYMQRSKLESRKTQWASATTIQTIYRRAKARDEMKQRWRHYVSKLQHLAATRIQKNYRGWDVRVMVFRKRASERARRIIASHIIIRAWRQYKDFKTFTLYKEAWIEEQSLSIISCLNDERREIEEDLEDINADIKEKVEVIHWASGRINELRTYLDLSADRLSVITLEMEELIAEQKDTGQSLLWQQDLEGEQERLKNQTLIAKEEMRLCKSEVTRAKDEITQLHHEIDVLYMDLDEVCTREVEEYEKLRRREVQKCIRQKEAEWNKRVRFEIAKWKVKDNFKKPPRVEEEQDGDAALPSFKSSSSDRRTISPKKVKHKSVLRKENVCLAQTDDSEKKRIKIKAEDEGNGAIHDLYSEVINRTLDILHCEKCDK